jgi:hypothetical protein
VSDSKDPESDHEPLPYKPMPKSKRIEMDEKASRRAQQQSKSSVKSKRKPAPKSKRGYGLVSISKRKVKQVSKPKQGPKEGFDIEASLATRPCDALARSMMLIAEAHDSDT